MRFCRLKRVPFLPLGLYCVIHANSNVTGRRGLFNTTKICFCHRSPGVVREKVSPRSQAVTQYKKNRPLIFAVRQRFITNLDVWRLYVLFAGRPRYISHLRNRIRVNSSYLSFIIKTFGVINLRPSHKFGKS